MKFFTLTILLLVLFCAGPGTGNIHAQSPAPPTAVRAEFLEQLEEVEKKIVDLAQAIPAEKFTWRPAEGVRSTSEVFMHIAGGNYLVLQFIGVQPPAGISRDIEKITDKTKVIETLKQSFEFVRQAVIKLPDGDLDRKVKFFSGETTVRNVIFTLAMHMHEHMGQAIAYARMNNIVPPWSAGEKAPAN